MCEQFDGGLQSTDDFRELPVQSSRHPSGRATKEAQRLREATGSLRAPGPGGECGLSPWPGHIPNLKQGRAVVLALLVATLRAHAAKKAKRDEAGWDHAKSEALRIKGVEKDLLKLDLTLWAPSADARRTWA